jgi:LIM domain
MSTLRRSSLCCRTATCQGNHVAQEVLQLQRVSPPVGLDVGLRRTRQGDSLPLLLRTLVRTKRFRLWTHSNPVDQRRNFCKPVRSKIFGEKRSKFDDFPICSSGNIGGPKPTDGSGCPRCGYVVYAAEQMISKNNSWHKRCFNCADCHRSLDSTNLCDAPNGEIYW